MQIYTNGTILTINDNMPQAEALAVEDGKIVAVGSRDEIVSQNPGAEIVDLQGRTLVPGFVDGHSHFMNALQIVSWCNVSAPPVGPVENIADILKVVEERSAARIPPRASGSSAMAMTPTCWPKGAS